MNAEQLPPPAVKKTAPWKIGCGGIVAAFCGLALIGTIIEGGGMPKPSDKQKSSVGEQKLKEPDGFNCLSKWDGSHRKLVDELKLTLRDPDSFKHIETRLAPSKTTGEFILFMDYRAANGFGGMNVGKLVATVKQDCSFKIEANLSQ